ncbi:aldo/keto reductase [Nonomuraea sp. NPDC004702]
MATHRLSGKFTRADATAGSRISRDAVPEHHLTIADEVDKAADELGVSSSQAALAWTRAHHTWIHPSSGARTLDQLTDNLAACDLRLPPDVGERLDQVSACPLGFPQSFIKIRGSPSTAPRSAASTAGCRERRPPIHGGGDGRGTPPGSRRTAAAILAGRRHLEHPPMANAVRADAGRATRSGSPYVSARPQRVSEQGTVCRPPSRKGPRPCRRDVPPEARDDPRPPCSSPSPCWSRWG